MLSTGAISLAFSAACVKSRPGFSAEIRTESRQILGLEGATTEILFRIRNNGSAAWESKGANPVFFSYHLLDAGNKPLRFENARFPFPRTVPPGMTVELPVRVKSPLEAGSYVLEFDLVREGLAWFNEYGSMTRRIPAVVERRTWADDSRAVDLEPGPFTKIEASAGEFNALPKLIRITLEHNQVSFEGRTGLISGFTAGSGYPQVWLRDAATIVPASRFYYGPEYLTTWIEEHLAFQEKNGSLKDWIDSRGASDKNTTETDQEASAVQAAYQAVRLIGPEWLAKQINGETVLSRLDRALRYVLQYRLDPKAGLIRGAHTADWGDVDINAPDQRVIYVDGRTHWTCDIYDQAMFFEAARNLASLYEMAGVPGQPPFWRRTADSIKAKTNSLLWQEDKGFYRMHIHLDGLRHDFDEDAIFPMGGNAQAVLSGLADGRMSRRIFNAAVSRQKEYGISSISGALLPPYPGGVFKHPAMDEPFEYQNGGQWDWFGGRFILAMFEQGMSRAAAKKLREVMRKNIGNAGLFEWDNPRGIGMGSDFYSGSAGSLARALFEGYLGLSISRGSLEVTPRVDDGRAKVHAFLPAAGLFLAYDYDFSPEAESLTLSFNSNFQGEGLLKVLSPFTPGNPESGEDKGAAFDVTLDRRKIPATMLIIGDDRYFVVRTDFAGHVLRISRAGT